MKSRNKEVNIFNMSLLDILCGALGAFCFMMLSLFPDHAKVKDLQAQVQELEQRTGSGNAQQQIEQAQQQTRQAQQEAEQARKERDKAVDQQSLAYFKVNWWGPADVDLWLMNTEGKYYAPKKADVPADKFAGTINDVTKGPSFEQAWFTDVAYVGAVWRLFARVSAANNQPFPIEVRGTLGARIRLNAQQSAMEVFDLGTVPVDKPGSLHELGYLEFTKDNYVIAAGPWGQKPAATRMLDGGTSRLLASPADLGIVRSPARP